MRRSKASKASKAKGKQKQGGEDRGAAQQQQTVANAEEIGGTFAHNGKIVYACRHGLISFCNDCVPRPCGYCNNIGIFESHCIGGTCTSRQNRSIQQWQCVLCQEVYCCTGLRSCCQICHFCERNHLLRRECCVCYGNFVPFGTPLFCNHHEIVCGNCIRMTAHTAITEGSICVRCPAERCSHILSDHELRFWMMPHTRNRFDEIVRELHMARLREFDGPTQRWLKMHAKQCPQCKVLIEKNDGCHHMQCKTCGHHFQWDVTPAPPLDSPVAVAASVTPNALKIVEPRRVSPINRWWKYLGFAGIVGFSAAGVVAHQVLF